MDAQLRPLFEAAVKEKKLAGVGYFIVDKKGNFLSKGAFGTTHLQDPDAAQFDLDTTLPIFSCTKLITALAVLQLVEQGKVALDDPVEKYVPRISKMQVLESIKPGPDGKLDPVLRPPKTKPTVLHLITHTLGQAYDFFEPLTLAWRVHTGRPPMGYHSVGDWEDFDTPFVSDPGSKYIYGIGIDWLGWIIEAVSGESLPDYLGNHICKPLGMNETGGKLPPGKKNTAVVHFDMEAQGLVGNKDFFLNESPRLWGGGGFLYSTMNDYAKLLVALLNNGASPTTGNQILKPDTVKDYVYKDLLGPEVDRSALGEIGSTIPIATLEGTFFPSMPVEKKGWSAGFMLNHEDLPYGRKAGSGAWAGLGNLFYWVDPATGIAGMIGTSLLPFVNPTVMRLFDEMERVAYGHNVAGEGGVEDEKRSYMPKKKAEVAAAAS
ncbi:beta-lactamase [Cladophialophora yegresii CBS 114405]|uniref:Beta-lactamase n=1 Tax=Cladophialophora yegresii CBS 114405 TaxID=1182544 RepID=W9VYH3_9EURO|nr:beta-lactamase [Cladophialophora yegresii CBS 114405]EXJ60852.1 beta-lactamase [Cladophialophora yegresii CBS 114405]